MKQNNLPRLFNSPFTRDEFITPVDKLFDKLFSQTFPELSKEFGIDAFQNSAYPKCDIIDFSDRIEIIAEIAGTKKENLSIDVDNDVIIIKGEHGGYTELEGGTYLRKELKRSKFTRTFTADSKVFNLDDLRAKFEDGTLRLTIPKHKKEEPTKRTISID